jgi:TolA-binding protein
MESLRPELQSALGGFRLLRELRAGTHGMVYLVEALDGGPIQALKSVAAEAFPNLQDRDAWLEAVRRRIDLDHPNLLKVRTGAALGRGAYVITEWAERGALSDLLGQVRFPPLPISVYLASELLSGLIALHGRGELHRAIKPSHILIGHDGVPLLSEPGIPSGPDAAAATTLYGAPELLSGGPASPRCDLFSLGATLYEVCCARPAFSADSPAAALGKLQEGTVRPPFEYNPTILPLLERVIQRLLAHEVERRYASAAEAQRDLAACREEPAARCSRPEFLEFIHDPFSYSRRYQVQTTRRRLDRGGELAAQGRIVPALWELYLASLTDPNAIAAPQQLRSLAEQHGYVIEHQDSAAEVALLQQVAAKPHDPRPLLALAAAYQSQKRILQLIRTYLRLVHLPVVDPELLREFESLLGPSNAAYLRQPDRPEAPLSQQSSLPPWEKRPLAPTIEAPAATRHQSAGAWTWGAALALVLIGGIVYLGSLGMNRQFGQQAGRSGFNRPAGSAEVATESMADLFLLRARSAAGHNDWADAARIYSRFLTQFPDDRRRDEVELRRAAALAQAGQADAAKEALELFQERRPASALRVAGMEQLAEIHLGQSNRQAAKELLAAAGAVGSPETAPRALFKLGQLLEQDGDWQEAIRTYETISMQFPKSREWPDAQLRLADLFEKEGDRGAAVRALEELLRALPNSSPLRRTAETILLRLEPESRPEE